MDTVTAADSRAAAPGSVVAIAADIRAGRSSAEDAVEACLDRIAAVEHDVRAWISVDADGARERAAELDADLMNDLVHGPLHGVPVAIKDIIDVAGWPTRCNSRARAEAAPATGDAAIVAALRAAGAIILGKAHTTEFAYFDPSPARNPHNLAHTPGGSSSGSAAAVAAGMVPAALGTQTVASVSRPAAYCGLAAFKPSTGLLNNYGIAPLAPMWDTVGFFGQGVGDAVALFDAVAPAFAPAAPPPDGPAHLVVLADPLFEEADGEVIAARDALAERFGAAGHRVAEAASPTALAALADAQMRATEYEMGRVHRGLLDLPDDRVGAKLREAIARGGAIALDTHLEDRRVIAAARAALVDALGDADAYLLPATPATAPAGLGWTGPPRFIGPWTAVGGPVVSLPAGFAGDGLPIGAMLAARPGDDRRLAGRATALAAAL